MFKHACIFFSGSTLAMGMADNSLALQDINHFSPVSLLIQSLVKQLCKLLANTPRQQKGLYKGNIDGFYKDEANVFNSLPVLS
jgi:hypothetical protein